MLYLVIPIFLPEESPTIYATINTVYTDSNDELHTVLNEDILNDVILTKFKEKYPNPAIIIRRLLNTEFYTISVPNASMIDLGSLKIPIDIDPVLSVSYRDSASREVKNIEVNKLLFNASLKEENDLRMDDYYLYENNQYNLQEIIQRGNKLINVRIDDVVLNNTDYSGSFFPDSTMNDGQFINARLIGAQFTDSMLNNANFNNADLRFADFSLAQIRNASFNNAILRYSNFVGADLTGADLTDADLRHANLAGATLTGCIINEHTRFYGAILDSDDGTAIIDDTFRARMNVIMDGDDIEYEEHIRLQTQEDEEDEGEIDYSIEDELAETADQAPKSQDREGEVLPPLVIDKTAKINDEYGQTYTFENIVSLLTPKITNVKIPLSQMDVNKWYGIASLGTTQLTIWNQVGVEGEPRIGKVFKSRTVSNPESGEAIVYQTVATCMAVHELSRMLDMVNLFKTFLDSVDDTVISQQYDMLTYGIVNEAEKLEKFAKMLYKFIVKLLSKHNADETADSWTRIYADIEKRKQLVKHAVFNSEEGLMYHPRFDYDSRNAYPEDILLLIMFIDSLPLQIQVAWAQNYIKEFIEGYGQQLETFDRTKRSEMGFIASCLNGNLEKFLLSIRPAIIQFYPLELEEETEEQKLQNLKNAVTGSVFQKYFETVDDISGSTLEGYKNYIQTNPEFNNKEELRQKYIELLQDMSIIDKITETISIMSGGRKNKNHNKGRKTIKCKIGKKTHKKKTHKKKTHKKKTHKKKTHKKIRKYIL
jgi:uncharacterized protein YjbI with pentapeptide repeats